MDIGIRDMSVYTRDMRICIRDMDTHTRGMGTHTRGVGTRACIESASSRMLSALQGHVFYVGWAAYLE